MNQSTFQMISYMNGLFFSFSKASYMNGICFEILARTPVPKLSSSYTHPELYTHFKETPEDFATFLIGNN